MADEKCACKQFERMEGASVPAYVSAFLDPASSIDRHYRCRVCGQEWEERSPGSANDGKRAHLMRLDGVRKK